MGFSQSMLREKRVMVYVYESDKDFFVLLLAHYHEIDCADLYIKTLAMYTHLAEVFNFLGRGVTSVLLPFHALTGCDITGKFNDKSKESWIKKFFSQKDNMTFNWITPMFAFISVRRSIKRIREISLSIILHKKNCCRMLKIW